MHSYSIKVLVSVLLGTRLTFRSVYAADAPVDNLGYLP